MITALAVFFLPTFMAALHPVLCQERMSSRGPSSLTGAYHPLESRSAEGRLSEEPVSELCGSPRIRSEQHSLAAFLILSSSRSPASLVRNFQTVFTGPAKPVSPPVLLSLPFALAHHLPVTVLPQSLRCAKPFPLPEPLHLLSFCSLARSCPHLTRVTPAIPEILPSSFIPFSKLCVKHFLVLPHSWAVSPYLTCCL